MIIGISGKIGSGKDTIANIINWAVSVHKNSPYNDKVWYCDSSAYFETKRFADKVKDIVCLLTNCTREQLENREFKEKELGEEWKVYHFYCDENKYSSTVTATSEEWEDSINYYKEREKRINKQVNAEDVKNCNYHVRSEVLTRRKLLQLIGTDCGRNIIHPNIWVNALMSEHEIPELVKTKIRRKGHTPNYLQALNTYPKWIIPDLRFPNELKAINDRNGLTIRVDRPLSYNDSSKSFAENQAIDEDARENKTGRYHESETALDNGIFDYYIKNDGTIEDLIVKVKEILTIEKII